MTKYCLLCEKEGHQTDECHSTHSLGSPRVQEIIRLRPAVFGGCLACVMRDRAIGQTPDHSVTPEYLDWLDTKSCSAGVAGNEAWNAGVAWKEGETKSRRVAVYKGQEDPKAVSNLLSDLEGLDHGTELYVLELPK